MKIILLPVIMWVTLLMNGGFFDDSVAFTGALISICLLVMLIKGDVFYRRDGRRVFLIPVVIMFIAVLVSCWSVDYMENFMGVMRLGVVCLWMWLIRCRKKEEIEAAQNNIPVMGCIIVLISVFSRCLPAVQPYFWENNRMSGFFQYANTNALFLAIGIMILIHHRKESKRKVFFLIQIFLLLAGLLLTGSRSILIFLVIWGSWYAIRTAEFRKPFLTGAVLIALSAGMFVAFTGNTGNIGRIFTVFKSNSTFWGRLLYDRDAIFLLVRKFYGLGRMGYYYSQGTFQSGVYHIRFVHNDFLQIALDYGVVALLLLLIFLGWQIFRGKQSGRDKEVLLFLCAASLVDFHCQYLLILMTACLFLDYGEGVKEKKAQLKENYILFPVFAVIFLYVGIAAGSSRLGNNDMALTMLPDYSYAQEKKIVSCLGTQESYELATRLIRKNPYNITAYVARGSFYASGLCVPQCIEDLNRMLELDPYNVEYYGQYEALLQNMQEQLDVYSEISGNRDMAEQYGEMIQERIETLPEQLEKMRERTSSLAYKIKDKPMFSYK
ncbi:MAG: O-antigen ligase family protein [Acetatifactor sp.]